MATRLRPCMTMKYLPPPPRALGIVPPSADVLGRQFFVRSGVLLEFDRQNWGGRGLGRVCGVRVMRAGEGGGCAAKVSVLFFFFLVAAFVVWRFIFTCHSEVSRLTFGRGFVLLLFILCVIFDSVKWRLACVCCGIFFFVRACIVGS